MSYCFPFAFRTLRPLLVKHRKEWIVQTCCISGLSQQGCCSFPHKSFLPLQSIDPTVCDAFQSCEQLLWLLLFSSSHASSLWKKKAQNSKNWPFLLLGHLEVENCCHYSCGYWSQQSTQIKPKFSKSIRFFHKTTWWTLNLLTGNSCFSSMDSLRDLKTTFQFQ